MSEEEGLFGYELSGEELRRLVQAPADERLRYFIDTAREQGQVWTIGTGDELLVLADDESEPFVVAFPHPEFGQDWIETTDLDEVDLVAVSTDDWADEILTGLAEAEVAILLFPTSEGEGILLGAEVLAKLLKDQPK